MSHIFCNIPWKSKDNITMLAGVSLWLMGIGGTPCGAVWDIFPFTGKSCFKPWERGWQDRGEFQSHSSEFTKKTLWFPVLFIGRLQRFPAHQNDKFHFVQRRSNYSSLNAFIVSTTILRWSKYKFTFNLVIECKNATSNHIFVLSIESWFVLSDQEAMDLHTNLIYFLSHSKW